jgi:hypothetical protein
VERNWGISTLQEKASFQIAYETAFFPATQLYSAMRSWEDQNNPFAIF